MFSNSQDIKFFTDINEGDKVRFVYDTVDEFISGIKANNYNNCLDIHRISNAFTNMFGKVFTIQKIICDSKGAVYCVKKDSNIFPPKYILYGLPLGWNIRRWMIEPFESNIIIDNNSFLDLFGGD